MRVIIAGSRNFNDYEILKKKLNAILKNQKDVTIISGTANGADKMGEWYANENHLKLEQYPAMSNRYLGCEFRKVIYVH